MFKAFYYLVIPLFVLSGCGEGRFLTIDAPDEIADMRTLVEAGKTSRSEFVNRFGEPFIRDDHLRVEVYRVSKELYGDYLFFFFIPLPKGIDDVITYALVVYDEHSIVKDIAWGYFVSSDTFDDNMRHAATLEADGFFFESFEVKTVYDRTEVLFARESDSQQSLHSIAPQGKCLLHIAPGEYEYQISLDNEVLASYQTESGMTYPLSFSVKDHGWFLGFITILIQPGEHTLSIVTRDLNPRDFERKFACGSGEKLYAYTNIEKYQWTDNYWTWEGQIRYRGEIAISDTIPEAFEGRRLILYHGDRSLAPYY